ncbi:MAG: ribonuclease R [Sedimentisphaerales bacterium]|nr:ribonuclease R [Sedimentisphaerales bacterium]
MHEILRNHILHLLQKGGGPRKLVHLERELGIGGEAREAFRRALDSLSAEGRVIVGRGNLVSLPSLSGEITGIFKANPRGYGFITPEQSATDEEVFIPAKATGNAMTGDRVVAEVARLDDAGRLAGKITKILARAHTSVVGTVRQEQTGWQIQPDGGDFSHPIQLEGLVPRHVRHGDKVSVILRCYPSRSQPARGVIAEILGRSGHFDTETSAIIQRHGLLDAFEPSALVEASNAKAAFDPRDTRGRKDITGAPVVTIDPPDAKDFDDAISLARDRQGRCVLGVHIADVSHFVPAGSALDRSARRRGDSVYLPGRTLPMLPEMLSNGICSLQPGQRRYTKSVYLTYNKDGEVQSTRFANTIMQSRARLTYQEVDRVLKGGNRGLPADVVALLSEMETLARCIESRRRRAGMLQLETFATERVRDEAGQVIGVQPEDNCYPHTIIEMFMIEANVAVASLLDRYCIPFMRRIHAEPDAGTLAQLSQTLRLLGVTLARRAQRSDIQALLDQVRGARIALPVNMLVLRSLEKAVYGPASVGHYALAASKYCHFTSPIRRYADLTVHRALQAYLTGNVDRARREYAFPELVEIGRHISETEQGAEDAERELRSILVLHLLRRRNECELNGVVTNLTPYGAAVYLPEYGVEGLMRREALGPDHWQFDERNRCLIGRHTGALLRLGQAMRVRIVDIHPAAGQLELTPAIDLIPKMPVQAQQQKNRTGSRARRHRNRRKGRPTA